ncbi:hypothetical protein [Massilia horti]|uniref:Secreted protein n=1 Tax=Massilia horti TaxID=2562153 RepID=A0A4Y9T5I6_9BURK|nr:hypothetical protein [Massilia horti]TFW33713.1 hypothetical protein E4O92_05825 [Massilia horti]
MKRIIVALTLAVSGMPCALALRPFDGTDAAVVRPGGVEFEFAYLNLLREGRQKSFSAPGLVANFGVSPSSELVAEGLLRTQFGGGPNSSGTSFDDVELSWKQVYRPGELQNAHGPSVASECTLLLPTAAGERTGAGCAGIISRRISSAMFHFNAALFKNRERQWERTLGVIVEAPPQGKLMPVFEIFLGARSDGLKTRSALAGVIVSMADNLELDAGLRLGRVGNSSISEIRAGLTWSPR